MYYILHPKTRQGLGESSERGRGALGIALLAVWLVKRSMGRRVRLGRGSYDIARMLQKQLYKWP